MKLLQTNCVFQNNKAQMYFEITPIHFNGAYIKKGYLGAPSQERIFKESKDLF